MKLNFSQSNRESAFSFFEVLVAVAVIGIISGIALVAFGKGNDQAEQTKLETDVAVVNSAISQYLAFGGNLDDLKDPAKVIAKLKKLHQHKKCEKEPPIVLSILLQHTTSDASSCCFFRTT